MAGLTLASRRTLSLTRSPSQKEASFVVPQWRTNLRDVHTYSQTLAIIGLHLIKKGHLFAAERIPRFFTKPDQRLTEGYPSECERVSREKVLGLDFFRDYHLTETPMLIMLDKRQRIIMPAAKVQEEIFRSMKVESGSKTPYTDATQVSLALLFSLCSCCAQVRVYAVVSR